MRNITKYVWDWVAIYWVLFFTYMCYLIAFFSFPYPPIDKLVFVGVVATAIAFIMEILKQDIFDSNDK